MGAAVCVYRDAWPVVDLWAGWRTGRRGGRGRRLPVIRAVATGDGSIGQLLGYHYLWNWAARPVGTPEQIAFVEAQAARNRWFFGGAGQPVRRGRADSR